MGNDPGTNGTVVIRLVGGLGNQMFQPASNSIAARLIRRIKRMLYLKK